MVNKSGFGAKMVWKSVGVNQLKIDSIIVNEFILKKSLKLNKYLRCIWERCKLCSIKFWEKKKFCFKFFFIHIQIC